jgi:F-box/leucine-rich repeat protein 2/20
MPIRLQFATGITHDLFDMSPNSSRFPSTRPDLQSSLHIPSSPGITASFDPFDDHPTSLSIPSEDTLKGLPSDHERELIPSIGKGKERELPPSLPPLDFSPTEFGYGQTDWPTSGLISPTPGPSSYGSGFVSIEDTTPVAETPVQSLPSPTSLPTLRRIPSRRRSTSNLSMHSDESVAARSIAKMKAKFNESSNIARRFLLRKREPSSNPPSRPVSGYDLSDTHFGRRTW